MFNSRSFSTLHYFYNALTLLDKRNFTFAIILLLAGSLLDSSVLLIVVFVTQLLSQQVSSNSLYNTLLSIFRNYGQGQILTLALISVCICFLLSFIITVYVNTFSCNLVSTIAIRKFDKFLSMPYEAKSVSDSIKIKNIFTQITYRIMAEVVNPIFRIFASLFNIFIISFILYLDSKNTFFMVFSIIAIYLLLISVCVKKTTKKLSLQKDSSLNDLLKYSSFSPSMLIDISLYPKCRQQFRYNYNNSLSTYLKIDRTEALLSILPRTILEFSIGITALIFCFQASNQQDFSQIILYGLAIQKLIPSMQKLQVAHLKLSLNNNIFLTFFEF